MSQSDWYRRLTFLFIFIVTAFLAKFTSFLFVTPETEAIKNTSGNSVLLPIYYIAAVIAFSSVFIILARRKRMSILKIIVAIVVAYSSFIILLIDFSYFTALIDIVLSLVLTAFLLYFSFKRVRVATYVIGIVLGAGIAVILASIISVRIAIIIMAVFSIYDSISVNVSGSMVELAETAIDSGFPLLFTAGKGDDIIAMGFGDTIIPTFGLMSVFLYYKYDFMSLLVPLLFVIFSFFPMIYLASKRPQPGLPYMLNALFLGIITYVAFFR